MFIKIKNTCKLSKLSMSVLGFLGYMLVTSIMLLGVKSVALAGSPSSIQLPENAKKYIPILKEEILSKWPTLSDKASLAGQIDQETCASLKSPKCWNTHAELKTSRERGIGLLQATIAYNKDGSIRFDAVSDIRKLDKDLSSWKDDGIWDPRLQMRALVVYDRSIYMRFPNTIQNELERLAFTFASFNGGTGGTMQDRRLCASITGCNPNLWFGNVEIHSMKQKIKIQGYGKSFFDINREYPKNILFIRKQKYQPLIG